MRFLCGNRFVNTESDVVPVMTTFFLIFLVLHYTNHFVLCPPLCCPAVHMLKPPLTWLLQNCSLCSLVSLSFQTSSLAPLRDCYVLDLQVQKGEKRIFQTKHSPFTLGMAAGLNGDGKFLIPEMSCPVGPYPGRGPNQVAIMFFSKKNFNLQVRRSIEMDADSKACAEATAFFQAFSVFVHAQEDSSGR